MTSETLTVAAAGAENRRVESKDAMQPVSGAGYGSAMTCFILRSPTP